MVVGAEPSHQTVRLSYGRHAHPAEGACVMELASMLAGEPFSDQPESVCPVIGSFLRTYNDRTGDERRQDLYRYASEIVGTKSTKQVERAREQHLFEWAERLERRRLIVRLGLRSAIPHPRSPAGKRAARAIKRRQMKRMHPAVLTLIDELIAMGRSPQHDVQPVSSLATSQVSIKA